MAREIIGSVAVKVVPDTSNFRRDAQRDLDKVERTLDDVLVEIEVNASQAVREAERAVDAAQAAVSKQAIRLKFDADNTDEVRRAIKSIDRELNKLQARTTVKVELNERELLEQRKVMEDILARNVQIEIDLDNDQWRKFQREVDGLLLGVEIDPELDPRTTKRMRDDMAAALEKIGKLRAELELDLTEREKRRIEHEISDLEAKIEVKLGEISLKAAQGRLALLARGRIAEITPAVNEAAAAKVSATLQALAGFRAFKNISDDVANWLGHLDESVPAIANASLAISNLASLTLSATSNMAAFGGSLATTAGAALALPGILGGMAIGVGASIAVLKDFNDVLPDVAGRFHDLQDSMSEKFWKKAKKPFENFINDLFPRFQYNIERTSKMLGGFFGSLATSATGEFGGELKSMFDDLNESIRIAGLYSDNFLSIIHQLGAVGAGNLPRLAGWFGDISQQFDGWLQAKGTNGLQEFVDTGIVALQDLGGILTNTGGILAGFYRAAEESGGSTLAVVRDTTQRIEDVVTGGKFQGALRAAFRGAHEGIAELADFAGPSFENLTERIAYMLESVLPTAGRTAGKALQGIFDALDTPVVEDSIVGLFENLETVIDNLAPSLPGVGDALAGIVDIIGQLGVNLSRALAPALDTLSGAADGLATDLEPLIDSLGDLLVNAVEMSGPVVSNLASILGDVAGAVAAILNPINQLIDLFQKLPSPVTTAVSALATIGILVAGGMWMGSLVRLKIAAIGTAFTGAAAQAGIAQGAFLRAGSAATTVAGRFTLGKGAIAGAGIAAAGFASQMGDGSDAVGALSGAIGGAAMGATFGPWGAVIGGAAGALAGYASSTRDSGKAMEEAAAKGAAYADTLNRITGATTEATRSMAYDNLEKSGALKLAAEYGVSARTMVDATLGQAKAQQTLAAVIATTRAEAESYGDAAAQILSDSGGTMSAQQGKDYKRYLDLQAQYDKAANSLQEESRLVKETTAAMQAKAAAVTNYAKLFKGDGIPTKVITRFGNVGIPATARDMAKLARRYDLMPDQVRTIISETGSEISMKRVLRLIEKLKVVDKTKASPKVTISADAAERQTKGVESKVKGLNKITGTSKVKVDDKATKPIKDVRTLLRDYAHVTVKATVDITDMATAKINAISAKLDNLNGKIATVTTNLRTVHTTERVGGARGRGGSLSVDTTATPAAVVSAVNSVTALWDGLVKKMRTSISYVAEDWLRGLEDGLTKIDDKIASREEAAEKAVTKAEEVRTKQQQKLDQYNNKVKAAEAIVAARKKQVREADNAQARIQAQKQLDAAEKDLQVAKKNQAAQQAIVDAAKEKVQAAKQALKDEKLIGVAYTKQREALEGALEMYSKINDELTEAVGNLESLQEEVKNYKTSLTDALQSTASILNGGSSFNSITKFLERQIKDNKELNAGLTDLMAMGLDDTIIDQLAAAGPDALAWVRSILAEGQSGVTKLNELWGDVEGLTLDTGEKVGNYVFVDELQEATDEVNRLYAELDAMRQPIQAATEALLSAMAESASRNAASITESLALVQGAYTTLAALAGVSIPNSASISVSTNKPKKPKKPKKASTPKSGAATRSQSQTLIYNAAPGKSLSSEEDLWDALGKAQGGW